jgi:PAS domain S-box-containing protein
MNLINSARLAWQNLFSSGFDEDLHSPFMRRVIFTNIFAVVAASTLFTFVIVNVSEARGTLLMLGELAIALLAVSIVVYLRKTRNIIRAQTLVMVTAILLMSLLFFTGGMEKTGIYWYYALPTAAFFLKGKRRAWAWLAVVGIEVMIMIALDAAHIASMPYTFIELRQFAASFIVVSLIVSNYERIRDDYETDIAVKTQAQGAEIRERKQAEAERHVLLEVMQGLVAAECLYDFLKNVHMSISKVICAKNFFVVLYNKDTALFEEVYSVDKFDPPALPAKLEKSICSYVFRSGQPLLLTQDRFDELAVHGEVELVGTNSPSWLGVPLKASGETIGVMVLQDYEKENRYSEQELTFLVSIAGQVALVVERKRAEDALRKSEERYRTLIENASDLVYRTDKAGKFIFMNQAALKITGYEERELIGKYLPSLIRSDMRRKAFVFFVNQLLSGTPNLYSEFPIITKVGHEIWVGQNSQLIMEDGQVTGFQAVSRDITERKQAEEETKRQLAEKEILLREVHHRIKNNIASIGGIISLRLQAISNPAAVAVLQDAASRINSMHILYEKLLLSEDYKDISVKNYLDALIDTIITIFPNNDKIKFEKSISDFQLNPKRLFPLGIIINEVLTNIMKYAFTNKDTGLIKISLVNIDNHVTLTIQDDGNGLPDGFDINKAKGFGLQLVKMLSKQLAGNFSIANHTGTRCTIEFNI